MRLFCGSIGWKIQAIIIITVGSAQHTQKRSYSFLLLSVPSPRLLLVLLRGDFI